MRSRASSPAREFLWLLLFLVIFAVLAVALIKFVMPHHFNDRIAIMLAGIVAALIMIALRGYTERRGSA